jgi:hypothetical protein
MQVLARHNCYLQPSSGASRDSLYTVNSVLIVDEVYLNDTALSAVANMTWNYSYSSQTSVSWTVFLIFSPISCVAPPLPISQLVQNHHRRYLFLVWWNSPEKLWGVICYQILFASQTVRLVPIPLPGILAYQFPLCGGCGQSYQNNVSSYVLTPVLMNSKVFWDMTPWKRVIGIILVLFTLIDYKPSVLWVAINRPYKESVTRFHRVIHFSFNLSHALYTILYHHFFCNFQSFDNYSLIYTPLCPRRRKYSK